MKRTLISITALFLLAIGAQANAGAWQEGKHYVKVAQPQPTSVAPDEVEVIEFFWYGCPHCYSLEPHIKKWLESKSSKVKYLRMPASLNPAWSTLSQAYFTAEALDVVDPMHDVIFNKIHGEHRMITSKDTLQELFKEHAGVNEEDFNKAWSSFSVASKMKRADLLARRFRITGVPAIIIDGKYATDATKAGSYANVFEVVDYVARQQLKAKSE